jgi:hypothetical protein
MRLFIKGKTFFTTGLCVAERSMPLGMLRCSILTRNAAYHFNLSSRYKLCLDGSGVPKVTTEQMDCHSRLYLWKRNAGLQRIIRTVRRRLFENLLCVQFLPFVSGVHIYVKPKHICHWLVRAGNKSFFRMHPASMFHVVIITISLVECC